MICELRLKWLSFRAGGKSQQRRPRVVEIWNNVFINTTEKQMVHWKNCRRNTSIQAWVLKGCVAQCKGKDANYDTDVFSHTIEFIAEKTGIAYTGKYDNSSMTDIAMRVLADHIRAVAFAIADGEMPGSGGAGYVIRRILRRSIRYNYTYLNCKEPFIHKLLPMIAEQFKGFFLNCTHRKLLWKKSSLKKKNHFKNAGRGLKRLDNMEAVNGCYDGRQVFELYDTYGFPKDLTRLIAEENGLTIDENAFEAALSEQRSVREKMPKEKQVIGKFSLTTNKLFCRLRSTYF